VLFYRTFFDSSYVIKIRGLLIRKGNLQSVLPPSPQCPEIPKISGLWFLNMDYLREIKDVT
jgi:hypothetical protein